MGQDEVSERGVSAASDELWEVAVRQAAVISRLAALDTVVVVAVDQAADELGVSRRRVYVLLDRETAAAAMSRNRSLRSLRCRDQIRAVPLLRMTRLVD